MSKNLMRRRRNGALEKKKWFIIGRLEIMKAINHFTFYTLDTFLNLIFRWLLKIHERFVSPQKWLRHVSWSAENPR